MGCGDGYATSQVARYATRVHGFDVNQRAIAFAELIVREPHVSFAVGGAGDLGTMAAALDRDVDVVAAFEVFEHLPEAEATSFLEQARELLEPGAGHLILTTPNAARSGSRMNPHHAHEYRSAELAERLHAAGFDRVSVKGLYLKPPWPRLEHFAGTVPFRGAFRALARAGRDHPRWCRSLVCVATPGVRIASS
jgi:2-polyprenyl-3-methyl-5-hydroxy-6-metoxy-1,4-benzoquinol methylase